MALLRREPPYDRSRLLEEASRARMKRRRRRAIRLYRRVLAVEPENGELHAKLAPLLAETGQPFDAWESYDAAGRHLLREGRLDRALGLYREAARLLPERLVAWKTIAALEHRRGRSGEAVAVLLEGRRHFRRRSSLPEAVHLLRQVREIEAWHVECVLDLARLLAVSDRSEEARRLLLELLDHVPEHRERPVCGALLRLDITPGNLWRWLRAAMVRKPSAEAPVADPRQA